MEAAHIAWRPLGQLFVERGLISQDELEDALEEQRRTRKRLGSILVERGFVSGPELTSVLVDQLGMELTKESGFGSGLWEEIRRRHPRTRERSPAEDEREVRPLAAATPAAHTDSDELGPDDDWAADEPHPLPEPASMEAAQEAGDDLDEAVYRELERMAEESAPPDEQLWSTPAQQPLSDDAGQDARGEKVATPAGEQPEWALAERAALEQALEEERAAHRLALDELELRLASLEEALSLERAERQAAVEELAHARHEAAARAEELDRVASQVEELRSRVERQDGVPAGGQAQELERRVAALEEALLDERATAREALDELELARSEAAVEARELRAALDRIRTELVQLDAATSWFEYWSGERVPPVPDDTQEESRS
ncbi:MAG TPA: hypothetical protein VFA44_10035 [Gaiellaceae bacterium]|nr:hypothetical protein [Gaiellaceae bacterium]